MRADHAAARQLTEARRRRRPLAPAALAIALAVSAVGCPCIDTAVNASPGLRWWLFSSFGAQRICPELTKRGLPLKVDALGGASVGRFFPQRCTVEVHDPDASIVVTSAGEGYATLPFVRRVGFALSMSVVYRPDFRIAEGGVWVWGRFDRFASPPDLRVLGVENPVVDLATQTPAGTVATMIGNAIVAGEVGRGFTVVHRSDGDDFAVGHLDPPAAPPRAFVAGEGHVVLASDVDRVGAASRDYTGPFGVAAPGQALFWRARVSGAPVTYALVERSVGEAWRRQYEGSQGLAPPPGPLLATGVLGPGDASLTFPVTPAQYYLVLENHAQGPPLGFPLPFPEEVALVSYSVELGDRP